jgi:ethanolamine utilization protein EutA
MHDLEFEHVHVDPGDTLNEVAWAADNVELTTVGIDIGSSTSHLMFARVHLQRLSGALSSRFVVVDRKVIWQSPILLTPYRADFTIDVDELAGFVGGCYVFAGIDPPSIDSGAVVLTGEALKRRNARAIAELFSEEAGRFVCASAGHHMECQMAAHGSGAVRLSAARGVRLLNVDIGGGTTKFALIERGHIIATAAMAVGGRLLVEQAQKLVRVEEPIKEIARSLGIDLALGGTLAPNDRQRLVERMAELVMRTMERQSPDELARALLVTDPWPENISDMRLDAITFSGGVAEYLYGREKRTFGDLGLEFGHELSHVIAHSRALPPVWDPGQGIRATVIGAAQFSVQISGNTILVSDPEILPLQNLPVLACQFELSEQVDASAIAAEIRCALGRSDLVDGSGPIALAFPWRGDPSHARLHAVAEGICAAVPRTLTAGIPLILLVDGDVGKSLGRIIRQETAPGAGVIALDGVQLRQFDYVDIGGLIPTTNVVPVIIKSLLFT